MLDEQPGVFYTSHVLPASSSGANSAYEAFCANPFEGSAYVDSIAFQPIEAITGDNTNTTNYNAILTDQGATEIAHLDFPTGTDGAVGTAKAFTFTGTTAQRTIAADKGFLIQREKVGTAPARAYGHTIVVGWKAV